MTTVKRVVLLLVLATAVALINADADPANCEGHNVMMKTTDLHKVYGDWVLVWSVSDNPTGQELLSKVNSSHINLELQPDNKTIVYYERNMYRDNNCTSYLVNLTLPDDDHEHLKLTHAGYVEQTNGVGTKIDDSGTVEVLESGDNCDHYLTIVFSSEKYGKYLLIYKREGHHAKDQMKAHHKKQAECLHFSDEPGFIYDGVSDFCHKDHADAKPDECEGRNVTVKTTDLDKVYGDWVLVWSVSDDPKGFDFLPNTTSSHVSLKLRPDNKTIEYNERNMFRGKNCTSFFTNLTIPDDDHEHHSLTENGAFQETNGVRTMVNDSAKVDFLESGDNCDSCNNCLTIVYDSEKYGRYLLIYKREGHHRDVEQMNAAHGDHEKLAKCLHFPLELKFIYDGVSDFCHKKSAPEDTPEEA